MKLYFAPGTCSLSPHIVALEAGIPVEMVRVDLATKKTAVGDDFLKVNPKGYVPALMLDNGEVLTEGPAITQYLASRTVAKAALLPKDETARYRVLEWLNFITSEIHKSFAPLFKPNTPAEYKAIAKGNLESRYKWIDTQLAGKQFLAGDDFTIADAYLFVVTNWAKFHQIDVAQWPNVASFMNRVVKRPKVTEAMKVEGLIKEAA